MYLFIICLTRQRSPLARRNRELWKHLQDNAVQRAVHLAAGCFAPSTKGGHHSGVADAPAPPPLLSVAEYAVVHQRGAERKRSTLIS